MAKQLKLKVEGRQEIRSIQPEPDRAERIKTVLRKLRVVFKSAQKHSRWVESQCGVSAAQLWALNELSTRPGLRVMDLAEIMSLHQSTVSNLLDKLEAKGLVQRERDSTDQRVVRLSLTAAATQILARAPEPAMSLLPSALYKLSDPALRDLDAAVTELVAALGVKDEEAALEPLTWI